VLFGRPVNLIVGAFAAVFNVGVLVGGNFGYVLDASLVAAINVAFAAVVALIANQPPVVNPGDTVTVKPPAGQPDIEWEAPAT
jgi:hypothetical protein